MRELTSHTSIFRRLFRCLVLWSYAVTETMRRNDLLASSHDSFVPTEVNRSNERQEHLRNLVLFYIGAPQQAKRAVESTEKKGNVAAFS